MIYISTQIEVKNRKILFFKGLGFIIASCVPNNVFFTKCTLPGGVVYSGEETLVCFNVVLIVFIRLSRVMYSRVETSKSLFKIATR